ncbi:hypothetical protein [Rhizobacter sp. P5_C2]
MNNQLLQALGTSLVGAALLAACGGGGSGGDAPAPDETAVPVSAAATPAAYTEYAAARVNLASDSGEPLSLDAITSVPTSETDEPATL